MGPSARETQPIRSELEEVRRVVFPSLAREVLAYGIMAATAAAALPFMVASARRRRREKLRRRGDKRYGH